LKQPRGREKAGEESVFQFAASDIGNTLEDYID